MIYLASPYSHPYSNIRLLRYHDACRATAYLIQKGKFVFSPIVNSHPLLQFGLQGNWQHWKEFDAFMIGMCDEMVILKLKGWKKSVGVTAEIQIAKSLGKPISKLSLKEIQNGTHNRCSTTIPIR